ncbi:MAG TPA: hypothetical protein VJ983_00675 [candidate division Zixibacteria bacterium]|nr:hypothetical protein [candidate division Zixibacteria bacterium]
MGVKKVDEEDFAEAIALLDDLIVRYYRQIRNNMDENPKLGDFLKMIELRRKVSPSNAEQRKFWQMLDEIRKEELGPKTGKSRKTKKRAVRPNAA